MRSMLQMVEKIQMAFASIDFSFELLDFSTVILYILTDKLTGAIRKNWALVCWEKLVSPSFTTVSLLHTVDKSTGSL